MGSLSTPPQEDGRDRTNQLDRAQLQRGSGMESAALVGTVHLRGHIDGLGRPQNVLVSITISNVN